MNRVHLARREQVTQTQQRGDGEESLDPRGAGAHHLTCFQAMDEMPELPADQRDGQQEASLHDVPGPLDATAPGPQRRGFEHAEGGGIVATEKVVRLPDHGSGEVHKEHRIHRENSSQPPRGVI